MALTVCPPIYIQVYLAYFFRRCLVVYNVPFYTQQGTCLFSLLENLWSTLGDELSITGN